MNARPRSALILPCLFLGLSGFAGADEPQAAAAAPATGKFYVVQADGRSRPQDPVRDGVAVGIDRHLSGPGQSARKTAAPAGTQSPAGTGGRASAATTIRITVPSPPARPSRDEFAAFRCEQHGFYYTNDGRCVVPAGRIRAATRP